MGNTPGQTSPHLQVNTAATKHTEIPSRSKFTPTPTPPYPAGSASATRESAPACTNNVKLFAPQTSAQPPKPSNDITVALDLNHASEAYPDPDLDDIAMDANTVMVNQYSEDLNEISLLTPDADDADIELEIQENEEAIANLTIELDGVHEAKEPSQEKYKHHEQKESAETNPSISNDSSAAKAVLHIANQPLLIGNTLWILSNATRVWRECVIQDIDTQNAQIEVHYISYSSFFDEWIAITSNRIAFERPGGDRLRVSDNISLYCTTFHAWIEAEVTAIDDLQDLVQIMIVSHGKRLPKQWLPRCSSLISVQHKRVDDVPPIMFFNSTPL